MERAYASLADFV